MPLPSQKLDGAKDAPPSAARRSRSRRSQGHRPRKRALPSERPAPEGNFLAACTADCRLVIVDGTQPPLIFTGPQTEKIAELCFANFKD